MRFWQSLSFTETDQLCDLARICEEVGFDGVLVSDHVFHPLRLESKYPYSADGAPPFGPGTEWPEPWAAISAMAAVTTRLRFNTAVYLAPLRHPLLVAKSVATAAVLSRGRVALGVGVGWVREEYGPLGADFGARGRRLDEMLDLLPRLWSGAPVEHHGEGYAFDALQMSPAPPARIPIYVGGASEAALRRAARCDGWIGSGNAAAELPALVERLRGYRRAAGFDGEFDVIAATFEPLEPGLVRSLEAAGVGGLIHYPLLYALGPGASLARKRSALEAFAQGVIDASR